MSSAGLAPVRLSPLTSTPLASVVMANYNYARFISEAVQSLLSQTYENWELVICDDGSTDGSSNILAELERRHDRIQVLYKGNGGQGSAWNSAYLHCRGEIICFLDADDGFRHDKLQKVVSHFQTEPHTGLMIHPLRVVGDNRSALLQIPYLSRFERGWIADRIIQRGGRWNDMPASALSARRELTDRVFPIPESQFRRYADGYISSTLALLTPVSAVDEPLAFYRVHGANERGSLNVTLHTVSHDLEAKQAQVAAMNAMLQEWTGQTNVVRIERNLSFQQNRLLLALLKDAPRVQLVRAYRHFAALLLTDGLSTSGQKALSLLTYAAAIALSGSARRHWLGIALGYNSLKQKIQRLRGR